MHSSPLKSVEVLYYCRLNPIFIPRILEQTVQVHAPHAARGVVL